MLLHVPCCTLFSRLIDCVNSTERRETAEERMKRRQREREREREKEREGDDDDDDEREINRLNRRRRRFAGLTRKLGRVLLFASHSPSTISFRLFVCLSSSSSSSSLLAVELRTREEKKKGLQYRQAGGFSPFHICTLRSRKKKKKKLRTHLGNGSHFH